MARLCAMKRTADMTGNQLDAWHGALSGFGIEIINAAVIELALTETRFPELGDLYQICRRIAIKRGLIRLPYSPHGEVGKADRPTEAEIAVVARQLGMEV